jgi:hypothetical protein
LQCSIYGNATIPGIKTIKSLRQLNCQWTERMNDFEIRQISQLIYLSYYSTIHPGLPFKIPGLIYLRTTDTINDDDVSGLAYLRSLFAPESEISHGTLLKLRFLREFTVRGTGEHISPRPH